VQLERQLAKCFQRAEWESSMASPETRTLAGSFPLMVSSPLTLVGGSQGTRGALANHKLPNQKFADRHQLFYIM
jgi:hypothetical protein